MVEGAVDVFESKYVPFQNAGQNKTVPHMLRKITVA